jgi:hypothetical protein
MLNPNECLSDDHGRHFEFGFTDSILQMWQRFAMSWLMGARKCDGRFIAPRLKKRIRAI